MKNLSLNRNPAAPRPENFLVAGGVALALCGSFLLFSTRVYYHYVVPKLMAISIGACAAWIGLALRARTTPVRRTPLDLPLLFLGVVFILSALGSQDRIFSLLGDPGCPSYGLLPLALFGALFYACAQSPASSELWLKCFLFAGAAGGLYGLLQKAGIDPFWGKVFWAGRVSGPAGGPAFYGSALVTLCPAALHMALRKTDPHPWLGWGTLFCVSAGLVCALLRGSLLSAALACSAYLLFGGGLPKKASQTSLLAAFFGIFLIGAAMVVMERANTKETDTERVLLWEIGLRAFAEKPLLGHGADTFGIIFRRFRGADSIRLVGATHGEQSAHNDLLEIASTAGVFAVLGYCWMLFALAKAARGLWAEPAAREDAAVFSAAILGLLVQTKFNPVDLSALAQGACFAGMLMALDRSERPPLPPAVVWAQAGVCAASVMVVGWICAADVFQQRGVNALARGDRAEAARMFDKSYRIHPWQVFHQEKFCDLLFDQAKSSPEPARGLLLGRALAVASRGAAAHPNDPGALHTLGIAKGLSSGKDLRGLAEAQRILDAAQRLDPYFLPLIKDRRLLAEMLGQRDKAAVLSAEYGRIAAMEP